LESIHKSASLVGNKTRLNRYIPNTKDLNRVYMAVGRNAKKNMSITQSDFDTLIKEEKVFSDLINPLILSPPPINWTREIKATNSKNIYLLDFYRGSFELSRYTYNKRYRQSIILLRYDNGGRHTNPDGVSFDGPHVHIFREGYNDKFAFPVSELNINETNSIDEVVTKLLLFCNVIKIPSVEIPMF
jgi:hypothetical protein